MVIIYRIFLSSALMAFAIGSVFGCAKQATLTVYSQPEGAYITERGTGTSFGIAPVTVYYEGVALLKSKDSKGCYHVKGFDARWVSGISGELESVRLCGSNVGNYHITFKRDPAQPGLEKDLLFQLKVQTLRAQQQQAKAAQDAAAAALFSTWATTQNTTSTPRIDVRCRSVQHGNIITTECY